MLRLKGVLDVGYQTNGLAFLDTEHRSRVLQVQMVEAFDNYMLHLLCQLLFMIHTWWQRLFEFISFFFIINN